MSKDSVRIKVAEAAMRAGFHPATSACLLNGHDALMSAEDVVRIASALNATLTAELAEARAERERLRMEIVASLTDAGMAMLGAPYDPTAPGEVKSAVHRLAKQRDSLRDECERLTAELEKETAHSKHLAGAVSRKIEDLIAAENQCGYYRTQYSRAEQLRKEACEANVKAQAAMLWLEADLERSRKECERLRAWCKVAIRAYNNECYHAAAGYVQAGLNCEKLPETFADMSTGEKT